MSKKTSSAQRLKERRAKKKQRQELMKLIFIGAIILIFGGILIGVYNANRATVDETLLVRTDSPILGNEDAPVTLVEFLDPECESCRAVFPDVKQLLLDYDNQIRLVVRYFPNHNNSVLAAAATEAAGAQGQYWEMQALLFERQPEWGEQQTPQTQRFIGYAQELGLDIAQFTNDLENPIFLEKIERDRQDANTLRLTGTPTFFINGKPVDPFSVNRIREMIDQIVGT